MPPIFIQYSSICKGTVYSTWCKFISYLHNAVDCPACKVTYTRTFRDQFSNAFNTYLAILQNICLQIDKALGRDAPDWQLRHNCHHAPTRWVGSPLYTTLLTFSSLMVNLHCVRHHWRQWMAIPLPSAWPMLATWIAARSLVHTWSHPMMLTFSGTMFAYTWVNMTAVRLTKLSTAQTTGEQPTQLMRILSVFLNKQVFFFWPAGMALSRQC